MSPITPTSSSSLHHWDSPFDTFPKEVICEIFSSLSKPEELQPAMKKSAQVCRGFHEITSDEVDYRRIVSLHTFSSTGSGWSSL
jgi:hypothetical protein